MFFKNNGRFAGMRNFFLYIKNTHNMRKELILAILKCNAVTFYSLVVFILTFMTEKINMKLKPQKWILSIKYIKVKVC